MNYLEMSNEFDVLYNNIMSNQAPGIDEYEKSLFLTKAQDEILKGYFNQRGNKYMQGYDGSEIRQIDFSSITRTASLQYQPSVADANKFDPRSKVYAFPQDCYIIVNEQVIETSNTTKVADNQGDSIVTPSPQTIYTQYTVLPITYTQYATQMSKPYKYPPKHIVWRLITSYNESGQYSYCEIIGRFDKTYNQATAPEYRMRYIKKPNPIILVNLTNGLKIEGESSIMSCELPEELHHDIVQRAVELAAATYNPQAAQNLAAIGNMSSTDIGVIPQKNND